MPTNQIPPEATSYLSIWQFMIMFTGVYSPKIIAFAQNPTWPKWKKVLVTWLTHLILAFAYFGASGLIAEDKLSVEGFISIFGQLLIYSWLSYVGIWKPRQINQKSALIKKAVIRKLTVTK